MDEQVKWEYNQVLGYKKYTPFCRPIQIGKLILFNLINVANHHEATEELQPKGYLVSGSVRPFRDREFALIHPEAISEYYLM